MCHQSQKGFRGIFVVNTQHKKGYLIYVLIPRKIVSSREILFDEKILVRSHTHHVE